MAKKNPKIMAFSRIFAYIQKCGSISCSAILTELQYETGEPIQ